MRRVLLLLSVAAAPVIACEVYTAPPPNYQAQVQVQAPPPPTAQVDVSTQPQDPNATAQAEPVDGDPSSIDDFKQALAPYGNWVDDPQYGTIWVPSQQAVPADFTPYLTGGHWVYDNDYTWVSDYDWGWAPFHYGRWFVYHGRRWAWVPGKEYAGAWVTWRNGDDGYGYVGWAPTPPDYYYQNGQVVQISTPWYEPTYTYATTGDLFAPVIRDRVIRDPGRIREIVARTRPYDVRGGGWVNGSGGARMRVRGPAPTRLGIRETAIPRVNPSARGVVRAQEFARSRPQPVGRTVTPGHPPIERGNVEQRGNMTQGRPGTEQRPGTPPNMTQGRPGTEQRPNTEPSRLPGHPVYEERHESNQPQMNRQPPNVNRQTPPPPATTNQNRRPPPPTNGGGRRR